MASSVSTPPPTPPLLQLRNVLLNLRLLSLIHLLSSHLHSYHRGSEIVGRPALPPLPYFHCAQLLGWSWNFPYPSDSRFPPCPICPACCRHTPILRPFWPFVCLASWLRRVSLVPPLRHCVGLPLYAVLKIRTQLETPTRRLRLISRRPHNELGNGPADHLLDPYGAHPQTLIQCNEATYHQSKVNRPGRGGGGLAIQFSRLVMTTLNSSVALPKRRSQFLISIASAPSAPAAPEILDATHVTSSYNNSRVTIFGTSSYSSTATHRGLSTGGTRMSGCFSQSTSATGSLVFVETSPGRIPPPHPPP